MSAGVDRSPTWYLGRRLSLVQHQVEAAVARRRAVDPDPDDRFRGLYVSDAHVDALLSEGPGTSTGEHPSVDAEAAALEGEADRLEQAGSAPAPLRALSEAFGLDWVDTELLLIAMAPDLEPRFERLYGYLNDDVSFRRASIGLALELAGVPHWSGTGRARFDAESPLIGGGLLEIRDADRPFLTRALTVPDRVIAHLLGVDAPELEIELLMTPAIASIGSRTSPLAHGLMDGNRLVYVRETPAGEGRAYAASAVAHRGRQIVSLDLSRIDGRDDPVDLAKRAAREARLLRGVLVAGPVEALADWGVAAVRAWSETAAMVVLVGSTTWDPNWSSTIPLLLDAPLLTHDDRASLWRAALDGQPTDPGVDPAAATQHFRLSPERVERAARAAGQQARAHSRDVSDADLRAGARSQNAAGLEHLARRVEASVTWNDLVLSDAVRVSLGELVGHVRGRELVYDEWGMNSSSTKGRGVKALFAGDSGTGKTVSAEAIANELGLDLFVIDLSTVVDKYVGETEKNLDRIFQEADRINGVLLFDEADALFGKRSEVKDAQDRYANVEVAYLLQRMERFEGLAVLTSNLRSNLDDAFARRLDAIIDFPEPNEAERLQLWNLHLRSSVPRDPDVDLEFLAAAFELTGGNIRNVCLAAAFLAADLNREVQMQDLIRATEREYRKLGRLLLADEFGRYHNLVSAGGP